MKKLILLTTFAFFLFPFAFSQQYGWTDISANIPIEADLSDVFFTSDNEGWITSSSHAEIYHTTDGGLTFEVQTTQLTCNAIHMLNENEGYAGGASGFIYKTANGGQIWDFYGTMVANLADISFPPTGNTGYCCGINGNIWSIDNSSVTKMISNINGNLGAISFPISSEEGWVCGGDVLRHFTSSSWTGDQDYPSGGYDAIQMVDNLNGWAVGDKIIHTTDGINWFEQVNPNTQNAMTDVFLINETEGWIVANGGLVMNTINSGEDWIIVAEGLTNSLLRGVHFTSSTNGYVVGNGKTLLKYGEITGIEENIEALKFNIYPNPAKDKFSIQSSVLKVEEATIEIYDLNGRKLLDKHIPAGTDEIEINVSQLEAGLFFCVLQFENQTVTKKLIIQK